MELFKGTKLCLLWEHKRTRGATKSKNKSKTVTPRGILVENGAMFLMQYLCGMLDTDIQ